MTDAQLIEHLHARGWRVEEGDAPMIREGAEALAAGSITDCDHAFEEHYKCSARDPSNAGDLAKFRDGWTAAVTAAAALYGEGDVAAPFGCSAWGEARQEGWIDGTQAYRDAIRRLDAGRGESAATESARARITAFLDEYVKRRGIDPEQIHSLGTVDEAIPLNVSDLRAVLANLPDAGREES